MSGCNYHLTLLIGDRSLVFDAFSSNEAIQATEIYEYAQKLSNPDQVRDEIIDFLYLKNCITK